MQRVGTIIHGALGDCYEQLCCLNLWKEKNPHINLVGFFATDDRMQAMGHFELSVLDEIHHANKIIDVDVDCFRQYQIHDIELQENILKNLPPEILSKFDKRHNLKPWTELASFPFDRGGIKLALSKVGRDYLPECIRENEIDESLFSSKFTVGYLWRYRAGGAVKPYFQRSKEWILKSKSGLLKKLIEKYDAHIFICGMGKRLNQPTDAALKNAGVVAGEHNSKYAAETLNLPMENCTYLKGLGYAAELEIMSRCDLLLTMPSGFSEPLWMMKKSPVVMVDPPPFYLGKLAWHKMPLFDNKTFDGAIFNNLISHTAENVFTYLYRRNFVPVERRS